MNRSLAPRSSRRFMLLRAACPLFAAGLMSLGCSSVKAANYYWDPNQTVSTNGSGSGTWDKTLLNWFNGGASDVVWTDGNTANFGGAAGTYAVNLGVPISALNIQFASSGYTVTASATNTLALTGGFGTAGAGATIYASGPNGSTNTIGGPITVASTGATTTPAYFTAAAGNTLNLTGTITQTTAATSGNTIFGPGTVSYSGGGFATGKFNVQGGATFNSSGTLSGFTGTYAGVGGDSTATSTWNVTAGTVTGGAATLFVGNGTIAGAGGGATSGVYAQSGGTATFAGVNAGNTFNGTTAGDSNGTVTVSGGTLNVNGIIRLGSTGAGVGALNLTGGRVVINSTTATIARGAGTGGATGGSGTINFDGGAIQYNNTPANPAIAANITTNILGGGATINTNSFNVTVASPMLHGGAAAIDGGITKTNGGILTFSATNTYTGTATINAGTLAISTNGGLGSGSVTLAAGATLSLATGVTAAHNTALLGGTASTLTLATTSSAVALNATTAGTVQDTVGALVVAGVNQMTAGTYGGTGSGANVILPEFSGLGVIMLTPVPEPSTWVTMTGGIACLLAFAARRQRRA